MSPDSKVVPTHINAYKADLAEAEKEAAQAQSKVEQLRETIATMEAGTADTPINDEAQAEAEAEEKRLANLKRDELEKEAKKAGVEHPEEAANKEELAAETVKAQRDESVQGEPEAAADGGSVDESSNTVSDEYALNAPSAEPASLPPVGDEPTDAPAADTIVHQEGEGDVSGEDASEPAEDADEPAGAAASSEPVA